MMTAYEVEAWCQHVTKTGACPTYEGWPRTVFGLGPDAYRDTIGFLKVRFAMTDSRDEYYACMPYLTNDIEPKLLFVPWRESKNAARLQMLTETPLESSQKTDFSSDKAAACGFLNQGNTNVAPPKMVAKRSPKLALL